jgi:hypothetical protein
MPHRFRTSTPLPRLILLAVIFAALLAPASPARAQGCALCRDNAASTPPSTQAGYRHAIALLAATASVIFAGTVFLLKRQR